MEGERFRHGGASVGGGCVASYDGKVVVSACVHSRVGMGNGTV